MHGTIQFSRLQTIERGEFTMKYIRHSSFEEKGEKSARDSAQSSVQKSLSISAYV